MIFEKLFKRKKKADSEKDNNHKHDPVDPGEDTGEIEVLASEEGEEVQRLKEELTERRKRICQKAEEIRRHLEKKKKR
jgi:hypothetical protein